MENTNIPQNNNHDYGVTTNDVMDFLKENMVMRGEFEEKFKGVATKEDIGQLREDMGKLKSELKVDMGKLKLDLIDAMSEKSAELRGDIVILIEKGGPQSGEFD